MAKTLSQMVSGWVDGTLQEKQAAVTSEAKKRRIQVNEDEAALWDPKVSGHEDSSGLRAKAAKDLRTDAKAMSRPRQAAK